MRYITAEQFRGQPEEVQKILLDWWEPEMHDMYSKRVGDLGVITTHIGDKGQLKLASKFKGVDMTPLFTLHQLWEFIEYELSSDLNISYVNGSYILEVGIWFHRAHKDKLQAFWECACEVARVIK
ncbi:MAG TPA: hypothetical protein GX707_10330 [Epulopiscium sp.]|nr:hypothetical protein [Candidatus Epulonipiscium sp.]